MTLRTLICALRFVMFCSWHKY